MDIRFSTESGRGLTRPVTAGTVIILFIVLVAATSMRAAAAQPQTFPVTGEGVHHFTTAIIHTAELTETGMMIQRSTDIVSLTGDLTGSILYHATSTFDSQAGTLVNTGSQFFSGTVAGSEPVVLFDDKFRFEVDLATSETVGEVHLRRSKDMGDGSWFECDLEVVGTGMTPEGDAMVDYTGTCTRRGR
jgi:hypothetical protein